MNQKLQDFAYEQSDYERPNLNRTTNKIATFESADGAGLDPQTGEEEVVPALTLPTVRARRGAFTLAMTALTIGFLLIAMNSPWSNEFLVPGPLSSPHAQLLAAKGSDRCADCHGAANESFSGWLSGHHGAAAQSSLCMKCHDNTLDAEFALQPHGISPAKLAAVSGSPPDGNNLMAMVGLSHSNEVACSVCHQEHHGNVNLSKLTDQQCQSCHKETFHSFESGHPEFASWPQLSRQNIAFDHGTHLNKHFKNANTEFNCNLCHVDGVQQDVKRLAPFEQACAGCHVQQIADSGQKGWTLFALPRIDMKAVEELKLDVGNWPMAATGDFDGDLPPMMRMLLAGDEQLSDVIEDLPADFSFGDVDAEDRQSVARAVDLVWGIKRLLQTLADDGVAGLESRLGNVVGAQFSDGASSELLAGLNPEIFKATAKRWLPELDKEIKKRQQKRLSSAARKGPMRLAAFARPVQDLLAENPVRDGDFTPRSEDASAETSVDTAEESGYEPSSGGAEIPSAAAGDSELLAENPLKGTGTGTPAARTPSSSASPRTSAKSSAKSSPAAAAPGEITLLPEVDGVVLKTGWYRDDRLLEIGYRPAGHADVFVKAWSDLIGDVVAADRNSGTVSLFNELNSATSAGSCRSCHTVNRNDENHLQFAWLADQRDEDRAAFTKFSHRPHLTQWSIRECSSCHRMNDDVSLVGTFASCEGCEQGAVMSNFHPITKADCASCHQQGRTESSCTQCHNYHVGHAPIANP